LKFTQIKDCIARVSKKTDSEGKVGNFLFFWLFAAREFLVKAGKARRNGGIRKMMQDKAALNFC